MQRLKSLLFPIAGCTFLLGLIPHRIAGGFHAPRGPLGVVVVAGAALILAGAALVVRVAILFADIGRGTPAPFAPPKKFVVQGPFRRMRNPIYAGIFLAALGEALYTLSPALLLYAVVLLAVFHLNVMIIEEPGLRRRFGDLYDVYCAKVPRWIPRLGK
jgi:protein-S-isoprenylcysteine O-methyltransferase Ste14